MLLELMIMCNVDHIVYRNEVMGCKIMYHVDHCDN